MSRASYKKKIEKYENEKNNITGFRISVLSKKNITLKFIHHTIKCSIDPESSITYINDIKIDNKEGIQTLKSYMDQVSEYISRFTSYININIKKDTYDQIGKILDKFNDKTSQLKTLDNTEDNVEICIPLKLFYELILFYNVDICTS
jgi:hypothetical protein